MGISLKIFGGTPEKVKFRLFWGNSMKKIFGGTQKKSDFFLCFWEFQLKFFGGIPKKSEIFIFLGISFWGYSKKNLQFYKIIAFKIFCRFQNFGGLTGGERVSFVGWLDGWMVG